MGIKTWRVRRPSPAMFVALTALVLSTSGTAVGASLITSADIKNNTIQSQDVRDNGLRGVDVENSSLTGADVKNNSLTGVDVDESTLGAVPNAAKVGGLSASQLVRASSVTNTAVNDNFAAPNFTTLASKSATAPTKGILLVWGSITGSRDVNGPATADLNARISVDGSAATTTGGLYLEFGGNTEGTVNVSGAIPVTAGSHSVELQALSLGGTEYLSQKSITTLFVPFGDSGGQGSLAVPQLHPQATARSNR